MVHPLSWSEIAYVYVWGVKLDCCSLSLFLVLNSLCWLNGGWRIYKRAQFLFCCGISRSAARWIRWKAHSDVWIWWISRRMAEWSLPQVFPSSSSSLPSKRDMDRERETELWKKRKKSSCRFPFPFHDDDSPIHSARAEVPVASRSVSHVVPKFHVENVS